MHPVMSIKKTVAVATIISVSLFSFVHCIGFERKTAFAFFHLLKPFLNVADRFKRDIYNPYDLWDFCHESGGENEGGNDIESPQKNQEIAKKLLKPSKLTCDT